MLMPTKNVVTNWHLSIFPSHLFTHTNEKTNILIRCQKTDIGGTLKKIPHKHIDRDLSLGLHLQLRLSQCFFCQQDQQFAAELLKRLARSTHIGPDS